MVAYSFKRQFCHLIESGAKTQTIRAHRKRHARVGETLQLFFGMRTKHCRKIVADPVCTEVFDVELVIGTMRIERIAMGDQVLDAHLYGNFARKDGFLNAHKMWEFWSKEHGSGVFQGVLIRWEPKPLVSGGCQRELETAA